MEPYDVIIVGAGPAGLSAAGHAQDRGLSYVLLERTGHLADTVFCYQKRKYVMAEPGLVPLRSPLRFEAGSREEVLDTWDGFASERGLDVRLGVEMTGIEPLAGGGFAITTGSGARFEAPKVVLAIGTQGNPRKLGVPGESLPHVTGRLVDPDEHRDRDVVVVGAGDSALEVALALCDHNRVALVVRKPEIVRAKEVLERETLARQASGELTIHFSTDVDRVEEERIFLSSPAGIVEAPADLVITKIGTFPPRKLLEGVGVEFTAPGREAGPVLGPGYESSVPGLHLIGAVSGRDLIKLGINQGYEVIEHILGREVEPADEGILEERLPWWTGPVRSRIAEVSDEIPLFEGAGEGQLREMFLSVTPRVFPPGEVILRQNDYTDSVFLIKEGEVEITVLPEGTPEKPASLRNLARLSAGNFFGEMSLISGRRRSATATAAGDGRARLVEIPRKAMLKLLASAPAVKEAMDRVFMVRAFQGYLFPGVEERLLWEVVGRAEQIRLPRDHVVFRQGDEGDAFYLIRSGQVRISTGPSGREEALAYLVSGDFFGEGAIVSDRPRNATVTTIFPTELIRLSRRDFEVFFERHPELRQLVEDKLEQRRQSSLLKQLKPGYEEALSKFIDIEATISTDALVIDNHKCIRCNNCIEACQGVHDDRQARLSLTGQVAFHLLFPNSCWQCEDPLCMLDCPPDAIVRAPSGEVYIKSSCIGCGNCEQNCPYDNVFMVHPKREEPPWKRWLASIFGAAPGGGLEQAAEAALGATVAVKCDLCRDIGMDPACVRSCPTGAAFRVTREERDRLMEEIVIRQREM